MGHFFAARTGCFSDFMSALSTEAARGTPGKPGGPAGGTLAAGSNELEGEDMDDLGTRILLICLDPRLFLLILNPLQRGTPADMSIYRRLENNDSVICVCEIVLFF